MQFTFFADLLFLCFDGWNQSVSIAVHAAIIFKGLFGKNAASRASSQPGAEDSAKSGPVKQNRNYRRR